MVKPVLGTVAPKKNQQIYKQNPTKRVVIGNLVLTSFCGVEARFDDPKAHY